MKENERKMKETEARKKKEEKKKKKRAQRGTPRDGPKKLIFYIRAYSGNREAIEAKKKIRF